MSRRKGRGYLFIRWSAGAGSSSRLGDVAWAFESIDAQGKLYAFQCGASDGGLGSRFWLQKCPSLPALIKVMSSPAADRQAYDEVKVFDVPDADPDAALDIARRLSIARHPVADPLNETRQVLTAYGVRGIIPSQAFSAPFLWYNILPGRSVPVRRLAIHLYEMRAGAEPLSMDEVESAVRKTAESVALVSGVGECFLTRVHSGFLAAVNISLDPNMTVAEARRVADSVADAIRAVNPAIRHLFVQTLPEEAFV